MLGDQSLHLSCLQGPFKCRQQYLTSNFLLYQVCSFMQVTYLLLNSVEPGSGKEEDTYCLCLNIKLICQVAFLMHTTSNHRADTQGKHPKTVQK